MTSFELFNKYRNFKTINEKELDLVINYICLNLNTCFNNYPYWYDMYCYSTKSRIVLRHKKSKNEKSEVILGECVCQNQIINFLEKGNMCNCNEGCASVYFNAVF